MQDETQTPYTQQHPDASEGPAYPHAPTAPMSAADANAPFPSSPSTQMPGFPSAPAAQMPGFPYTTWGANVPPAYEYPYPTGGYPQPYASYQPQPTFQPVSSVNPEVSNENSGEQGGGAPLYPYATPGQPHPYATSAAPVPPFVEQSAYETPPYAHTVNGGIPAHAQTPIAEKEFDYSHIFVPARIAIYDSLKTAPRVIEIDGGPTHEYIERIASMTFRSAKELGGTIPYTVIREVSENFIHARFQEVVVSILDDGNTIRFADQGPGIPNKDLAQEPGVSSAIEPMKRYIRGVGSGLPIVKDYLDTTHGYIEIEDNINQGAVVTISLVGPRGMNSTALEETQLPPLTDNERAVLKALAPSKTLGVTEMNRETGIAVASIHTAFSKMEEAGLVQKVGKKRTLTDEGRRVCLSL